MDAGLITQLGVGGIFAILLIREFSNLVVKTKAKSNGKGSLNDAIMDCVRDLPKSLDEQNKFQKEVALEHRDQTNFLGQILSELKEQTRVIKNGNGRK